MRKISKDSIVNFVKRNPSLCVSVAFFILSFIIVVEFIFSASYVAISYRSGAWTKAYLENITQTYSPVSFLATESGLLFGTILAVTPIAFMSLVFYLWHLNSKIANLEKQLLEHGNNDSK